MKGARGPAREIPPFTDGESPHPSGRVILAAGWLFSPGYRPKFMDVRYRPL